MTRVIGAGRARRVVLVALTAAAASGVGCRRRAPEAPPETAQLPATREVDRARPHLYTFARPDGTFETIDKPEDVPAERRRVVRVIDPSAARAPDATTVYVVDVAELLRSGKATARALPRDVFETGALALLPPGQSSALADAPPPDERTNDQAVDAGAEPDRPVVILYGAAWCGACKAARSYLGTKRVPFVYKDIERDPAASRELAAKAARAGVPANRIPILDVRGRLMIGFDQARLDGLLGEVI